jgi:hypothetical protein
MLRTEKMFCTVNHSTVLILLLCVILLATSTVQAQKKPPILTDKTISAFNVGEITKLQSAAGDVTNPAAAKLARNKLIAITVEQVDTAFNEYRTKSRKNTDRLNFLFDFLEIGASSAISIVKGGLRAKSMIGEGLSLFQGSRSAFNKDFRFLERQILFDKMVAKRSEKLTAIYGKLNQETLEYPWEQARSELRDYFFAGTIDEALSGLSRDTGAAAATAVADLAEAKKNAGIVGAVSTKELAAHRAFGTLLDPLGDSFDAAANAITKADEEIAAAQKKIDEEALKPAAQQNQATITAANTAKATAEGSKKAPTETQAKLLAKMKALFAKVLDNPILTPVLPEISKGTPRLRIGAAQKQRIEDSLKKARDNTADFRDYQRVLLSLRAYVVDIVETDPRPSDEFQKILVANQ